MFLQQLQTHKINEFEMNYNIKIIQKSATMFDYEESMKKAMKTP